MKHTTIKALSEFMKFIEANCQHDDFLYRGQREEWPLLPKLARMKPRTDTLKDEDFMLTELQRHLPSFGLAYSNEWSLLAIAQHHGMATRLLDWSSSPLVALWFAVAEPAERQCSRGVVFVLDYEPREHVVTDFSSKSPRDPGFTEFFVPDIVTDRIRVQKGYFSAH